MDTSTLVFVAVLAVAFVVLRWLITPIPQSVPQEFNIPDPARAAPEPRRRAPRAVSDAMVEIVQAIGPQLTRAQIVHSLERTGNVEDTVNVFMETGTLPFPPGQSQRASGSVARGGAPKGPANLLERYDIGPEVLAQADENGAVDFEGEELQRRRVEMIVRARKRLEKTLSEPPLG